MNIKLMQELKARVLANAQRLNMAFWGRRFDTINENSLQRYFLRNQDKPQCNTVVCLGGETMLMVGQAVLDKTGGLLATASADWASSWDIETAAAKALDLTETQANNLFFLRSLGFGFGWPAKFEQRYLDATTVQERAQAAADRIQYMIDTGE